MKQVEKDRLQALTKDLKGQYGPVMRRAEIQTFLKHTNPGSTATWLYKHGLTGKAARYGYYYTDDIAKAFVTGCA